ncbi:unnamed protein product [Orchesella dallaii]|uniref:Partial AB-hydrolase lipase domain-containing protein n=1 Tax=Orchesella dallaii TaxID=48710 RepID=A0ABP1RN18_9HEXA
MKLNSKADYAPRLPALLFLQLIVSHVNIEASQSQSRGPACFTYRPTIPKEFYRIAGTCQREIPKSIPNLAEVPPTTVDEIEKRGYYVSTHTILSEDGYTSAIYRIYGGPKSPPKRGKQAVLLFHGGGGGSASWIIQPGSRNLAFLLVDSGYEAWLANARGTGPSKNHTRLNADTDLEYWDFSFEEIGVRDLPLFADLIRWKTGNEKVYYVCHSVGCALYLAGLSEVPNLSEKFKAGFLLAPGAFLGSGENPFVQSQAAVVIGTPLQDLVIKLLGGRQSGEPNPLLSALGLTPDRVCTWSALRCGICDNALFAFYGADAPQLDYENLPDILRKLQDNLSLKVLFHGIQRLHTCEFLRYDYGEKRNLLEYGTKDPPSYNMGNVRVPLHIFSGESDNLVAPPDTERLWNAIPSASRAGLYRVNWPLFHHIDFLMARDADILVYNGIVDTINRMERGNRHYSYYNYKK